LPLKATPSTAAKDCPVAALSGASATDAEPVSEVLLPATRTVIVTV